MEFDASQEEGPAGPGDARTSGTSWLLAGVLGFVLGGAGLYLGLSSEGGDPASGTSADAPRGGDGGELSVPAEVVDFPTLDGDTASLADYRGQVVVLNLWGTWCPPCREEIPDLVELQARIEPRGGTVIGLAVDSGEPSSIREFAEEFGINYPIWHSRGQKVVRHYEAMGFPTTVLIDRDGVIQGRRLGPQSAASLMEDLEPLLSEG